MAGIKCFGLPKKGLPDMKSLSAFLMAFAAAAVMQAQLYFPPNDNSATWDTLTPSNLSYCQDNIDSLYAYLASINTKAFILLKDGKIVLEQYFDGHDAQSPWYWASAGKTLTAFMVGIAQQEGYLSINEPSGQYLGTGWTACAPAQENDISIWHQLTMTSGLADAVPDPFCTLPECLVFEADAGTRWAYHNGPYTLLDEVIASATGLSLNAYITQKVKTITGMDGVFLSQGYNNVFFSTARSMARFGLIILNGGRWADTPILTDTAYFHAMTTSSQSLNPAYGYLWWLNGTDAYMLPQTQFIFQGPLSPHAPSDMIAALGKNGQILSIVPSEKLIWIRMGEAPENTLIPFLTQDAIWAYIQALNCGTSTANIPIAPPYQVFPNPSSDWLQIELGPALAPGQTTIHLYDNFGQCLEIFTPNSANLNISLTFYPKGHYSLVFNNGHRIWTEHIVKR